MDVPTIQLNDGSHIPQIGLGTWQITDPGAFDTMFDAALAAGYRHFDTAQIYHNEQLLGAALKRSKVARPEVFITTKIDHFVGVAKSLKASLDRLQMPYVDLVVLHFPIPLLRKSAWRALEELQADGKARSIGVSNYTVRHLKLMKKYAQVVPAVNQVEQHVFLQQPDLQHYCRDNGIVLEAYSPLAHASSLDNGTIKLIAAKHHKSYAQIMLRWCIQNGFVVLPKSKTPSRLQENIDIFDFELDAEDLQQLQAENRDLHTCAPTKSARFMP